MKLSLSVRIVETADKSRLQIPLEEFISLAAETGYDAICMRASAAGVQTPVAEFQRIREQIAAAGLQVSMVTADFQVPLNNSHGPDSLRNIEPSLQVAEALGCTLIRVCLKRTEDIPFAAQAVESASQRGIRLAHQCHTTSLFEQVTPMLDVLNQINHPGFGLIYEPANLMLCGESYGIDTLEQLAPRLMNVYLQNHRLDPRGPVALDTYCLGSRRFHHLPLWEQGGVDFDQVFRGLNTIGYDGFVTVHQAEGIASSSDARTFAARCANFLRKQ